MTARMLDPYPAACGLFVAGGRDALGSSLTTVVPKFDHRTMG
jgi:hypothetical protein